MSTVSPNNRVLDYVKFNSKDKVVAEYVDYLSFYGSYRKDSLIMRMRDNDAGMNLHGFHFTKFPSKSNFILKAQKYYKWQIIDIFQLRETIVAQKPVLKVDIYWKWLLILNREWLWEDFELSLQYFGMIDDLILTRVDYCVDCEKMAWDKPHTLKTKMKTIIRNEYSWEIEYIRYWQKRSSPQFLRFYNKIIDLERTNSIWLYPEYKKYKSLMRYELQIQSDGIAEAEKVVHYSFIKHIANFGLSCSRNKRSHHKHKVIDRDFIQIQRKILEYKKEKNYAKLSKLVMLLEWCALYDFEDMNGVE